MFLVLLVLFVYVLAANSITLLHKIYLFLHSVFMLWPLFQFISQTTPVPQYRLFYLLVAYTALSLLGIGWFFFVVMLTGQGRFIRKKRVVLFSMPAAISVAVVITNPGHMFLKINTQVDPIKQLQGGPFYWVLIAQLFLYLMVSVYMMLNTLRKNVSARHQTLVRTAMNGMIVLLLFGLADLFMNVIFIERIDKYIPLISVGLTMSAIYLVHAITRHRVFDIIQIVQRDVMNTMSNGIVVLDENDIIIEVNKIIKPILKLRIGDKFNPAAAAAPFRRSAAREFEAFFEQLRQHPLERLDMEIALHYGKYRYVVVQAAPIMNQKKTHMIGRLITFHDVSELRLLVEETNVQNELLQERNQELLETQDELFQANRKLEQMAITDSLTGCFNRRYLLQQLEHEVAVNIREGKPFSIFLFDIDFFKAINDKHGHLVGDEVLCATVDAVKYSLRETDILARYGGEEFTVYLPDTDREHAYIIADLVKEAVEHNKVKTGLGNHQSVSVTISMGVVSVEQFSPYVLDDPKSFLRELLAQADAALYEAKYNGRNRIVKRKLA